MVRPFSLYLILCSLKRATQCMRLQPKWGTGEGHRCRQPYPHRWRGCFGFEPVTSWSSWSNLTLGHPFIQGSQQGHIKKTIMSRPFQLRTRCLISATWITIHRLSHPELYSSYSQLYLISTQIKASISNLWTLPSTSLTGMRDGQKKPSDLIGVAVLKEMLEL